MKTKKTIGIDKTLLIIVLSIIGTCSFWLWYNPLSTDRSIDYEAFGTYGDFYGGVIGTIIAAFGAILIYNTYITQTEYQKKDQIESRFFELLKLHEKNVEELLLMDRNIFSIYLRNIKNFIVIISEFNESEKKNWNRETLVKLGYLCFFYGISDNRHKYITETTGTKKDFEKISEYMIDRGIEYNGVYADFGKYFRQLFQIVTYINNKELDYKEKYEYIKALRVRLNIEEQYLLILNSLISIGSEWGKDKNDIDEQLITKYNIIKNIPKEYNVIGDFNYREIYPNVHYEDFGNNKSDAREKLEQLYS